MLEIKSVNKSYGKKQVLFDVSYRFSDGVYGLLGPNGAGKSTLLQIMTDNLACDSGDIVYEGKSILRNSKHYRKNLGYVPQLQGMYEMFSAYQFLAYLAAVKGIKKADATREVERVLKVVGLYEESARKLSTYSGGMKQRILIAQALLGDPKVMIMDEPTAGLDPKERIRIRNFISRISEMKTVIIATHVVSDVDTIAKEVLLLGEGRIKSAGSINELCRTLEGKVYETIIDSEEIGKIENFAIISNIQELPGRKIKIRFILSSKNTKETDKAQWLPVAPNLQEVYLYTFSEKCGRGEKDAYKV